MASRKPGLPTGVFHIHSSLLIHRAPKVNMWVCWHPEICSFSQIALPWRTKFRDYYMLMRITVFLPREVSSVYSTFWQFPIGTVSTLIFLTNWFQLISVFVSFIRKLIQKISQQKCCWAINSLIARWRTYQVVYPMEITYERGHLKALVSDCSCPKEHHQLLKMCLQKIAHAMKGLLGLSPIPNVGNSS